MIDKLHYEALLFDENAGRRMTPFKTELSGLSHENGFIMIKKIVCSSITLNFKEGFSSAYLSEIQFCLSGHTLLS